MSHDPVALYFWKWSGQHMFSFQEEEIKSYIGMLGQTGQCMTGLGTFNILFFSIHFIIS